MKSKNAKDKKNPQEQNADDDFLSPLTARNDSGIKDPEEVGDAWHICRDFLDPLANELEAWVRSPQPTIADIELLLWFDIGMDGGAGPEERINAWRQAKAFLDVKGLTAVRDSLERAVSGLAQQAAKVLSQLEVLPLDGEESQWRNVAIASFQVQAVEPCLADLRAVSAELKRHSPAEPSASGDQWITVSEAAKISACYKGVITRAANAGHIKTNGKTHRARRLDAGSVSQWILRNSPSGEPVWDPAEVERRAREVRENRGVYDDY